MVWIVGYLKYLRSQLLFFLRECIYFVVSVIYFVHCSLACPAWICSKCHFLYFVISWLLTHYTVRIFAREDRRLKVLVFFVFGTSILVLRTGSWISMLLLRISPIRLSSHQGPVSFLSYSEASNWFSMKFFVFPLLCRFDLRCLSPFGCVFLLLENRHSIRLRVLQFVTSKQVFFVWIFLA